MRMPSPQLGVDLHVHAVHSDGLGAPYEVLRTVMAKRLDGLAITDHDTLEGYFDVKALVGGILVLPGIRGEYGRKACARPRF